MMKELRDLPRSQRIVLYLFLAWAFGGAAIGALILLWVIIGGLITTFHHGLGG